MLKEEITVFKLLGLLWSVCGLALIVVGTLLYGSKDDASSNSIYGYLWLAGSMLGYAFYYVFFTWIMLPHIADFGNVPFLGFAGVGSIGTTLFVGDFVLLCFC